MSILTALTNRQRWARYWDSLKYAFYTMFHPFDGFWDLTHEKRGSMAAAHTIVIAVLIVRLLGLEHTSFLFNNVYWPEVNILQQCLSVLLPLVIFVVGNWGLTTLFDGKGRLKDVYMGTCYALFPYVLLQIPMIILSNWITVDEASKLLLDGTVSGGMIPKIGCCVEAVRSGVPRAHILDGRIPHSILIELLSDEGVGTMIL